MPGKKVRIVLFLFILTLCGVAAYKYFSSLTTVVINYKNAANVKIYKSEDLANEEGTIGIKGKAIDTLDISGSAVKLKKNHSYTIIYDGSSGYDGGSTSFDATKEKREININPHFTSDKLLQILKTQKKRNRCCYQS